MGSINDVVLAKSWIKGDVGTERQWRAVAINKGTAGASMSFRVLDSMDVKRPELGSMIWHFSSLHSVQGEGMLESPSSVPDSTDTRKPEPGF